MRKQFIIAIALLGAMTISCTPGKKAQDFKLGNWDNNTVTMSALKDKVVVLVFSYAYCSVRCPVVTARLYSLDAALDARKDVVYLHVSVDPEMDTAERRRHYFELYSLEAEKDNRWMFVSGAKGELEKLWKFYGVAANRIEVREIPEGYYMEYTQKMAIIDKKGFIRYETDYNYSEDEVVKEIKKLI
ncbi:MAG: SCO family protein [Nitrospirae bacterium]|nr:SCO family protein [Nitrospirota bacterium]